MKKQPTKSAIITFKIEPQIKNALKAANEDVAEICRTALKKRLQFLAKQSKP